MPKGINHVELLQQASVEAVLERREERVVRLVVWFQDIEVSHENCSAVRARHHGKPISTGGQKFPLAGSLLRATVSRGDVQPNQMDRPAGRGDRSRGGSR